jgi:ribonuclease P protein component
VGRVREAHATTRLRRLYRVGLSRGGFGPPYRPHAMPDQRFPKTNRLRTAADFRRVYDRRRSVTNGRITVCGCENDVGHTRLGVSVSRKVGSAVVRNRWKRMLREAFRLSREKLPASIDLVVVAKDTSPPELAWLVGELSRLATLVAGKLKK